MPTIVSKFGGSSIANAACFPAILNILRASLDRRFVVLSAPGTDARHPRKVTEMLSECWQCRGDKTKRAAAVERVVSRFAELSAALGIGGFDAIAAREIHVALRVSEARTLSRGEYLCAALFSAFSGIPLVDAADVICFDGAGDLDADATLARMARMAAQYPRAILPGFYGADGARAIHTFPRNGSDITGALAAAGTCAALYENWTDVPGLMTADPAVVPDARLIPQVSYRQMRALARAGARVLHPACLDPVALAGIPTRLRCTTRPESFGTLIDEHCDRVVPCIAGQPVASLPGGQPAARISVFGASEGATRAAAQPLSPLRVIRSRERVDVCVEPGAYTRAARHLHRALILQGESSGPD